MSDNDMLKNLLSAEYKTKENSDKAVKELCELYKEIRSSVGTTEEALAILGFIMQVCRGRNNG